MKGLAFFDTNILVYADDASSPQKQTRAIALVTEYHRRNTFVVSLQVMQEYFAAVTRKLGVDPEIAQRKVEILARGRVVRFNPFLGG
jgi:predicted nucleic acid-binding protein